MNEIAAAHLVAFYLFDVAESADLAAVAPLIGGPAVAARLTPKSPTPSYVQYGTPPVSFDGDVLGLSDPDGFRTRVRVYEYGVVSIALVRAFSGSWAAFVDLGRSIVENAELEAGAERACRIVIDRLRPALKHPR